MCKYGKSLKKRNNKNGKLENSLVFVNILEIVTILLYTVLDIAHG